MNIPAYKKGSLIGSRGIHLQPKVPGHKAVNARRKEVYNSRETCWKSQNDHSADRK